ncbi:MAG: hypothetical protein ABW122_04070 [Ilumatobacteraceae bacterium]
MSELRGGRLADRVVIVVGASEEARSISGTTLDVDGGLSAAPT